MQMKLAVQRDGRLLERGQVCHKLDPSGRWTPFAYYPCLVALMPALEAMPSVSTGALQHCAPRSAMTAQAQSSLVRPATCNSSALRRQLSPFVLVYRQLTPLQGL